MTRKITKRMREREKHFNALVNSMLSGMRQSGRRFHCDIDSEMSVFLKFVDDRDEENSAEVEIINTKHDVHDEMHAVHIRVIGGGWYFAHVTGTGEIDSVYKFSGGNTHDTIKRSSIEEVTAEVVGKIRGNIRGKNINKRPAKRKKPVKSPKSVKRHKSTRTTKVKS